MGVTFSAAFADSRKNKRIAGRKLDRAGRPLRTGEHFRPNTSNVAARPLSVFRTVGINFGMATYRHLSAWHSRLAAVIVRPPEHCDFRETQALPRAPQMLSKAFPDDLI